MKIGIGLPISHQGVYLPSPFAGPQELVQLAQEAESLGFYSGWGLDFMTPRTDEQMTPGKQPQWHEIIVSLSYLAAVTKKLRLGTASVQLPLRDPFLLAKQAATLDVFSNGRFMLGLGLGTLRTEFLKLRPGDRKIHRGRLFVESIEAMHAFMKDDSVTRDGEFYACDQVCMLPKPIQDPFPLYLAGTTDDTPNRIAKWGSGWLLSRKQLASIDERLDALDDALSAVGRQRSEIDLVITKGLCLGRSREEAFERFYASGIPAKMDEKAEEIGITDKPSSDINRVLEQNLIGTPADIIEQLQPAIEKGINHCVLYYYAANDFNEMMDQIRWFGEEVLPHVQFRSNK
jgi:probable F420-dependent oxidoreductase